jgi:hypothetical protein
MKIKVYVIDVKTPRWLRRALVIGAVPVVVLGLAALVYAALPTPVPTFTDGTVLSAASLTALGTDITNLDTRLAVVEASTPSNFTALQNEITTTSYAPRAPSAFHALLDVATTVPNTAANGPGTIIVFDAIDFDLGGEYNRSTGTFTAKNAGIYSLHCAIEFNTTTSAAWVLALVKNGVQVANVNFNMPVQTITLNLDRLYQLKAGDAIQCAAFQDSGSSLSLFLASGLVQNDFSGARIY